MEKYFLKPILLVLINTLALQISATSELPDGQMDPLGDDYSLIYPHIIVRPRINSYSSAVIIANIYPQNISLKFEYPIGNITVSLLEYGDNCVFSAEYSTSSDIKIPYSYNTSKMAPTQILIRTSTGDEYEGWINSSIFSNSSPY